MDTRTAIAGILTLAFIVGFPLAAYYGPAVLWEVFEHEDCWAHESLIRKGYPVGALPPECAAHVPRCAAMPWTTRGEPSP